MNGIATVQTAPGDTFDGLPALTEMIVYPGACLEVEAYFDDNPDPLPDAGGWLVTVGKINQEITGEPWLILTQRGLLTF